MADGGDGPDELFVNQQDLATGTGLVGSVWEQQQQLQNYFQTYQHPADLGYYHTYPPVDASAELFDFPNHVNFGGRDVDSETWAFPYDSADSYELDQYRFGAPSPPQSQPFALQVPFSDFAEQMASPRTHKPQQNACKQEYSPPQAPLTHQYPAFDPPAGNLASPTVQPARALSMGKAPPSPTSPVPRKRRASRRLSPSSPTAGSSSRPTRRTIKRQVKSSKEAWTARQDELIRLVEAKGTGVFHRHIRSQAEAHANHAALMSLYAQKPEECTTPLTDGTFPVHDEDKTEYVGQLYRAICDWTNYCEMAKTLGPEHMAQRQAAAELADDDPRKQALLDPVMSLPDQQRKVLSRELSDYVVEQLCWRMLEQAQLAQQGIPNVDYWSGADGA